MMTMKYLTWVLALGCMLAFTVAAQSGAAGAGPSSSASPSATLSPLLTAPMPDASVSAPTPSASPVGGSPLMGTWKVERAIFELFGNLKDVLGQDERFYGILRIDAAGKGSICYGNKTEEIPIEYDFKNGQSLTIAFGSRLKPQVDLYNVLLLGDGGLFLRSTRLAQVNGTIFYLLKKSN